MDIGYTLDNKYFQFNPFTFNENDITLMKSVINISDRRLVVITDPHIKYQDSYNVYQKGLKIDRTADTDGVVRTNIFVKSPNQYNFVGHCWPGTSVWVDFLNERARDYWSSLYSYDFFNGTNRLFHIWIDMNEPSVFSGPELTMPKNLRHIIADKVPKQVLHRDVHNLYGTF